ncbi:hypothetical protein [Corynebacterium flavescens]|uniref:hypothetical protein n=1 Tax=Corynebacterium flavescens TaxID=28028 RepID=UPI003FD2A8BA
MYQLISDGGTMTVGRRTASYVWGEFQVTLNDGLEQAEPADDRLTDAFIYRPDDRGTGRAELTFVRADAQVDMNAEKSDLEQTLDGASRRTEGEAFYTREISGLGLGRTKPGVHYVVGDLVNVLLWGRRMTLPVSAINAVSTDSDPAGWSVQVGGQMLRDAEAQRKRNSQIDVQIAREKRQRLKEAGQIRATANSAASGVKDLNETLAGPSATSDDVLAEMQALAEQLTEHGEDAPAGLIPAYMASNNERWRLQTEIDRIQDERLQEQEDMQEQIRDQLLEQVEANKSRVNVAFVSDYGCSHPDVEFTRLNPGWRAVIPSGSSMLQAEYYDMDEATMLEDGRANFLRPTENWFKPPSGENRIHEWTTANKTARFTWVSAPIRAGSSKVDGGSFSPARLSWVTRGEHTISPESEARQFAAVWTVRWAAVNRGSTYRARIVTSGGTVLAEWGSASIGPWSPLGDGRYTMRISCQNKAIPAGQDVRFQVYTSGGGESQRAINSTWSDATWIEDA